MKLIFIRHGETDFNREGRLQGQRDIGLNAKGRAQASSVGRSLAKLMRPELDALEASGAFIASPLARTRETMELARTEMGYKPEAYALDEALKELTFGAWEGLTWPEVRAHDPQAAAAREADKWNYAPPNGESYAMLAARIAPWAAALTRDTLIVSHGGVARALMWLKAGVTPEVAAEANIHQGRAIVFAGSGLRWVG